jgi:hypothetical protein
MRLRDEVLMLDVPTFEKAFGYRWMRSYCHVVGVVQWFYVGLFGWIFYLVYWSGSFYHPAYDGHGKGSSDHPAYYDYRWLIYSTATALLVIAGLLGGYGLLRLRRWVRWPELAYLVVLSAWLISDLVEFRFRPWESAESLRALFLLYLAPGVPCVPLLSRAFITLACRPIPPPMPEKRPAEIRVGVWDASLDG